MPMPKYHVTYSLAGSNEILTAEIAANGLFNATRNARTRLEKQHKCSITILEIHRI